MRIGRPPRGSRGTFWLAALIIAAAMPVDAQTAAELIQSQHVLIRQRLEPAEPVYVGQPVRLWIDVLTRTWFLQAPRYPQTIEVRNAIVVPPEAFGVNATERLGGETYAVQSRAFTLFPQTTGRFEVPPVEVTLVVARDDASPSPEILLSTEPVTLEVRLPAGAEGHGLVLSTPALSAREEYSRPADDLKVGDSFERRVTLTIEDSVAMLLPPMRFEASEGIAVYPARPEVTDQRNRGRMTGTRVDSATYVMESEGTYRLPEVSFYWWNLKSSRLAQETLPAVELTVAANPGLAAEHLGEPEVEEVVGEETTAEESELDWRRFAIGLSILAFVLLVALRLRPGIERWMAKRRRRGETESVAFRQFESAASGGDAQATYAALVFWLDRFPAAGGPVSARDFVAGAQNPKLARQYDALERSLYGTSRDAGEPWSGEELARSVARERRRLRSAWHRESPADGGLPPLNPRGISPDGSSGAELPPTS